jgi:hypothetical protein
VTGPDEPLPTGEEQAQAGEVPSSEAAQVARTARRFSLLTALPVVGLLLFVIGGVLMLRAFSHNHSLACNDNSAIAPVPNCSHDSYALPITLGAIGVVIMLSGIVLSNYLLARDVGSPLLLALRRWSRQR